MRAALLGLDQIPWEKTHPNHLAGAALPSLIRELAVDSTRLPKLADALLHQGTRFGGAGEAVPFLVELATADETPDRSRLLYLAAGIGAPVESTLAELPFDREALGCMSDEELWDDWDNEFLDGFAAMCALDGRAAWSAALPDVSRLVDDSDPEVRLAAIASLAEEAKVPSGHEERLARALDAMDDVGWHAALGLGKMARSAPLAPNTIAKLEAMLGSPVLVRRVAAGVALAYTRPLDDDLLTALAEAEERFQELSVQPCRFEQALMGMVFDASRRATDSLK